MKRILLITLLLAFANIAHPQSITRGVAEGEIYISQRWYWDFSTNEFVHVVWHSTDHGRHLTNRYASTTMPQQGTRFDIVADATPGVLYGWANDSLFISNNYAQSWSTIERCIWEHYGNYTSGIINGEIYKRVLNQEQSGYAIERSTNYGIDFNVINHNIPSYYCEVGVVEGELFSFRGPIDYDYPLDVYFSNDFGLSFILQSSLDPAIGGYHLMGYYPTLSRGAEPGELYLVTWHLPSNYHIYYSIDYGKNFTLQYQSDECNFYYWGYSFSAGREPGSFYVKRSTGNNYDYSTHTHLYIDYSTDYGQSFTTFFHDTHSGYDGNPTSVVHTLTLQPNPPEGGTVQGAGRYSEGDMATISATPAEGYEFINWTEGENPISELPTYTFTVERTLTLVANFKLVNSVAVGSANLFNAFPNPFSSSVIFKHRLPNGEGLLSIRSMTGSTVFTGKLNGTQTPFDLSHLPQGAYIYAITTDGHPVYQGVVVKQ